MPDDDDGLAKTDRERALEAEVERLKGGIEAARAEGEELFHAFMKHSPLISFIKDEEGRHVYINEAFQREFGFDAREWKDKTDFELWSPETAKQFRDNDVAALSSAKPFTVEETISRPDGEHTYLSTKFRFCDRRGRVFLAGAALDITEHKRLELLLGQAARLEAIGRLAGGIAHDFNNLLTSVVGNCELAQDHLPKSSPASPHISEILAAAEHAARLTRQLLAFARRQVIAPKHISLNDVLRSTQPLVRRLVSTDIELELILAPDLGMVRLDPTQLEQVVLNLVGNANDAMPGGGRLTIETQNLDVEAPRAEDDPELTPGRYVVLIVKDTGVGIGEETRARIFEPFFTTKELGHGTGLGLATSHGIVKQNGGHIWVQSAPGEGSTFKACWPRVEDRPAAKKAARDEAAPPQGSGETVLIVDDDDMVRRVTARMIVRLGYSVLQAQGPDEALAIARTHMGPIDLVISDVIMPAMRGTELEAEIRLLRPGIATLLISGHNENSLAERNIDCGDAPLLRKPFQVASLAEGVSRALATRRRGGALR